MVELWTQTQHVTRLVEIETETMEEIKREPLNENPQVVLTNVYSFGDRRFHPISPTDWIARRITA